MKLMPKTSNNFPIRTWLAIIGSSTILLGAAYTMVQQDTRQSADDLPLS